MNPPGASIRDWTPEQLYAIERRSGELFLDAGAGSGKTAVLVERFVRAVLHDEIEVAAILTITFTDKAAGEMRERIRERLRQAGALAAARDTEGAFISTIHGFCARLLRTHALAAGLDPAFGVLDEIQAGQLAERAFDSALQELAADARGRALIATYGVADLRAAVRSLHAELRSQGQAEPRLPEAAEAPDLGLAAGEVLRTAAAALAELGALRDPSSRVAEAIERLERVSGAELQAPGWPGDLWPWRLPSGNGAALACAACEEYTAALDRLRQSWATAWAADTLPKLDGLLSSFGRRYAELKREQSALDFQDLELECAALLRRDSDLRGRYQERFARVMVDELQDTNAVQLELIEAVADANLFTVGDAQQAIYGFRHADVALFERRGERLAAQGGRATLQTNFRSRPEILGVINRVFAAALGTRFRPLVAGRSQAGEGEARVELLLADREADWAQAPDGLAAPWRLAEARLLADRVAELIAAGAGAGEVVVLTRASTDLRAYEKALEARAVPTYLIGGRGYWSHPQVIDMVAYLRLLANPRDEEALYTVLASPLVGASYDTLVLLGAAARATGRDPWWVLSEPGEALAGIEAEERERVQAVADWVNRERVAAPRRGVEELLERVIDRTGYDLAVLGLSGGRRRLANIRKLMRLARQHELAEGPGLRSFLDAARHRARGAGYGGGGREGEAPVESESLDAVRLMTIHRAKGLEFKIVCVADLGRGPWRSADVVRVSADGRVGVRIARPGSGAREPALDYEVLGDEQKAREADEERRLFYVAATRAQERLIFSGAARLDKWGVPNGGAPISWLGPALVADLPGLVEAGEQEFEGVAFRVVRPEDQAERAGDGAGGGGSRRSSSLASAVVSAPPPPADPSPPPVPSALSYSSLAAYKACGYRFYVERVLRLPPVEAAVGGAAAASGLGAAERGTGAAARLGAAERGTGAAARLGAAERGTVVHALLERIDFRRPVVPSVDAVRGQAGMSVEEAQEIIELVGRLLSTDLVGRLGRSRGIQREQPFGFLLAHTLITGVLDVIVRERPGQALVVDYKTDRLEGAEPAAIVTGRYGTQRLVYALAALRDGAREVEVVHVFLERPEAPVVFRAGEADLRRLEAELGRVVGGLLAGSYRVTESPHRGVCAGCPAEGGLCSWPLEMTRREAVDRLF